MIFLPKPMTIYIAIAVIIAVGGFVYMQSRSSYKIVETRDFSCPGMEEFTFKYPVLKGWEVSLVKKTDTNSCEILLTDPLPVAEKKSEEYQPRIVVAKLSGEAATNLTLINPQGIRYAGDIINSFPNGPTTSPVHWVTFYDNTYAVKIELLAVGNDFPRDQFFKTVIESFEFVYPNSILEHYINKQVTLYGVAKDAKAGAGIFPEESGRPHRVSTEFMYIKDLAYWPKDIVDQTVEVKGILRKQMYIPGDKQFVLENATWKIVGE